MTVVNLETETTTVVRRPRPSESASGDKLITLVKGELLWKFLLLCTFSFLCLCRSMQGDGNGDDEDDNRLSPESKAERERIRRQANNNRER